MKETCEIVALIKALVLTSAFVCWSCQDSHRPPKDIAPCWKGDAVQRASVQNSLPAADPLAASGYFPKEAFLLDDYCRADPNSARQVDERSILECQRNACMGVHPPGGIVHGRNIPWSRAETELCVREYASRYDRLNSAFGEPLLSGLPDDVSAYRLYQKATTAPVHVMVRVVKDKNGATVVTKRMESKEVPNGGRLVWQFTRQLTQLEWDGFAAAIAKADYWSLPVRVKSSRTQFDGYSFTLEGARGSSRHLVMPSVPEGPLEDMIAYMARLGDCQSGQVQK